MKTMMKTIIKTISEFALNIKIIVTKYKWEFISDCFFMLLIFITSINGEYTRLVLYTVFLWVKEVYLNLKYRKNYIMVLFYFTIMFFIISRPLLGLFLKWHWESYNSTNSIIFVFLATALSMIFINYGALLYDDYKIKKTYETQKVQIKAKKLKFKKENIYNYKKYILKASFIIWIICFACQLIINIDKLMYVIQNDYVEYYVSYKNTFPLIINVFVTLFQYIVLIILALKPKKTVTILVLSSNIIVSLPLLLMGMRNGFIMNVVFTFVYLLYRYEKVKKILYSRKFMTWAFITVLLLGGFMNLIGNFREGKKNTSSSLINSFMEFGYYQGTTFDTIRQTYAYKDKLPEHKSYTFGPIIDYIYYGRVGQIIFKSIDLGDGNNILKATQGNILAHHLSYEVMKGEYLEGHGRGSSYISELYLDFGYAGVCVASLLLGVIMQMIQCNIFKRVGSTVFYLGVLANIWLIPRASYADIFQYLFTYQFWFVVFLVVIFAFIGKLFELIGDKVFRRSKYEN